MKFRVLQSIVFLITAFLLVGCGVFENEQIEDDPEEEIERIYNKTIERNYSNEFERALIDSAEAAYPPRDSVAAAVPSWSEMNIPETGYWYYFSFDGILIPFAITKDAIGYYSSLIDSLEAEVTHQFIKEAYFEYESTISFKEEYHFDWPAPGEANGPERPVEPEDFENVYVVELSLKWNHIQIDPYGMTLLHGRVVIFDQNGNLIRVFLDGKWPFSAN